MAIVENRNEEKLWCGGSRCGFFVGHGTVLVLGTGLFRVCNGMEYGFALSSCIFENYGAINEKA